MLTNNEKYIVKVVIFFVSVTGLLTLVADAVSPTEYASYYIKAGTILFMTAIVWFGREWVFHKLLNSIPATNPGRSITDGNWNLKITFNDQDEKGEKQRTGSVSFKNSLIGVKVNGNSLLTEDNNVSMNGWHADNAELIKYDKHEVLYYLYKIPVETKSGDQTETKYEKIGFVCATKSHDSEVFNGYFRDIRIGSDFGKFREGKIILNRH